MAILNFTGSNVLLVDDSKAMRALIRKLLIDTTLPIAYIHEAENGLEAINALKRSKIDLVITDLNMPIMNGLEMLDKINGDPELKEKNVPILVVSTDGSQEAVITAVKNGAKGYIRKPFDKDKLAEKIGKVLGN